MGTLMSRMESCSTAPGFSYTLCPPIYKIKKVTFFLTYPRVGVVEHHEDDEHICAACCPHRCHHPLLPLQEQPPAIRHDEQQLGCLCGHRSEVRLKHWSFVASGAVIIDWLACAQFLWCHRVLTHPDIHFYITAARQEVKSLEVSETSMVQILCVLLKWTIDQSEHWARCNSVAII